MGEPIQIPIIPWGTDCPRCVPPAGSRWGVGETPLYIYATFSGITNCGWSHHPAPNGLIFRLTQNPAFICEWHLIGSVWHVSWIADRLAPNVSQLRLGDHDGWSFFTDQQVPCPAELQPYVNDQAACILMYAGAGGSGTIWWNEELLTLAEQFGLDPSERLKYDVFPVNSDYLVHRFADQRDHTNIKIKKS